ncbi:hypothetical protein DD238_008309 [Peronospora effusa]|uniref:Ketopantoate reductase C-terminal domain-containing protein n=1 Tax=Peronospora effusa TaxID=542832 RepID=A0A3M6V7M2_9STRA|nr:hypothetical protein DD238_008309 [Peronospora effusa]
MMLRVWRRRWVSAMSNSRTLRAAIHFPYSIVTSQEASVSPRTNELRVGVLGLGAIGTIFFTRLGLLATDFKKNELPILHVEAFIKREQFGVWTSKMKSKLSLEGQRRETLEFQVHSDEKVATVENAPNVRVRTLENTGEDGHGNKLDILLVAVKTYDSVGVIRELREKKRHLLKHDALCVLLQNGLGEVPQEEEGRRIEDRWQFASGVTFVGGRVLRFGSVVTSGLETGKTYIAPFDVPGMEKEINVTREEMLWRKESDAKMHMLARVFLAADTDLSGKLVYIMDSFFPQMMLRVWRRRWVSAMSNSRTLRAAIHFPYSIVTSQEASVSPRTNELRVGVLGLGAIGTIFFTRLGLLATDFKKNELPILHVEAFIKREQFGVWTSKMKSKLSLEGQRRETLEFQVHSDEKVATVENAPNVRVRTLENTGEDGHGNKLDILLVAVKTYDSVGVIRELREKKRHLLKHDALCVLLQNGLGEVPQEEEGRRIEDRWQFASGVTFVGGRVLRFGSVVTSGLETGKTYIAPFDVPGMEKEINVTREEMLWRKESDAKMHMLARVFLAAGLHCEVLDANEMQAMLWRKLIVNAAINPVASLLDAPNRSVASTEGSRHCVNLVVQEAIAVANCEKIPLNCSYKELVEDIFEVALNTGANVCSMLADLRREIDAITGRIVAGGKRHGVPTPTNELLLSLIKALEDEGSRRICTSSVS